MYKQGDILLIPIPFSDLTSNKKRPVLVLSNDEYNNKTDDLLVAAITSNVITKNFTVGLKNDDMQDGSLKMDSCIRADKIYTLSQSIVVNRFGSVKKDIINEVIEKLIEVTSQK